MEGSVECLGKQVYLDCANCATQRYVGVEGYLGTEYGDP